MLAKTYCAAVVGLEATTITIEVNMTRGVMFSLSGMADTAVRESYSRISAALPNVGFRLPLSSLTINLSPADIRKEGSSYDLPIAVGMLAAHGKIPTDNLDKYIEDQHLDLSDATYNEAIERAGDLLADRLADFESDLIAEAKEDDKYALDELRERNGEC
jgi:hypothetical protein